jgi:hypothetical protein
MHSPSPLPQAPPCCGKFLALLATSRVANVPSVVSNVSLGCALAAIATPHAVTPGLAIPWALLCLAGILLYVSGNFLNDWQDRPWDTIHRPERALPSGLFPPGLYLLISLSAAAAAMVLTAIVGAAASAVALLIWIFIAIYTRWHKATPWAVIPMGMCRALLIVLGAVGILHSFPPTLVPHAFALLLYIAALSLSARFESSPDQPPATRYLSRFLLIFSGLMMSAAWFSDSPAAAAAGLIPFMVWLVRCLTRYRRPIPAHVSALLAGIPLLDWVALVPLALTARAAGMGDAFSAACLIIPPLAFASGRLLQRVAPAT